MRPSLGLDYRVRQKLLAILAAALSKNDLLGVIGRAAEAARGATETLPEVHLFTPGGRAKPAVWMLPRLKCDAAALVYAYEAFAEQPMGGVIYPGRVAEETLKQEGAGNIRRVLTARKDPQQWFVPAVLLVAMSQLFPDTVVDADLKTNTFSAIVDGANLQVTPRGVFSNIQARLVPAALPPTDVEFAAMRFAELEVTSPTLVGLTRLVRGDRDLLGVLRGLQACIEEGLLTDTEIAQDLSQRNPRRTKGTDSDRQIAADEAIAILGAGGDGLIKKLYDVLVPTLYPAKEFLCTFGSTTANPKRKVREGTLSKWAQQIIERV